MNDGYVYRESVSRRVAGRRLDDYLAERYTHFSLDEWRAHIVAGRVRLDGVPAPVDVVLRYGQDLAWHRPPWREPDAPLSFAVLYERGGILVVDKPAGLPTMAGGGFLQHTLVHQLSLLRPKAAPVHRLGRWTSGAVLCTRDASSSSSIAAQFSARSVHKRYRALALGHPARDHFEIDVPIGPLPYPPLGTLHAASAEGRWARSQVTVVERRPAAFLCDVTISTGRPHQIRIHLASAGHPLVGDPLYGVGGLPLPGGVAVPGDRGYHLHAAEIGFSDPVLGDRVTVLAPPPRRLRRGEPRD